MRYKVALPIIAVIIIFFMLLYFKSPLRDNKDYPVLSGSFIQADLVQNWSEDKWHEEFKYFKENKMNYVVLTGINSVNDGVMETVYKSELKDSKKIYGSGDEVELCLKEAQKMGIKVFLGTDFNSEWWKKSGDDVNWMKEQMERTNLVCHELYKKYHYKYSGAFYGWYFPYEVDNVKFSNKSQFLNLASAININLRYLKSQNERLPFLMSPFMNSAKGTAKEYSDNWKYFFSKVDFSKGDVFCPQDSIGSGGLDINQVNPWFTALKKAVDSKPGLEFWANAETFDYVNNSSATLDRFQKQLQLEQPCVNRIISFSYSHYYSPNNIDAGFNKAYSKYVQSGNLFHKKVDPPNNLRVSVLNKDEFQLTWEKPKDNGDICGYRVYRNGILIFNPIIQRKYGGQKKEFYLSIVDKPLLKENVKSYIYVVKAVDFSGNLSKSSNYVTVHAKGLKIFPRILSLGCKYTLMPSPDVNYDKDILSKITDGRYAVENTVKDSEFAGWYSNQFDIEVDLGTVKQVRQFMVDYYREPRAWAMLPKAASVSVSSDGTNFAPVGLLRIPTVPFSERGGKRYPIYFTLDKSINARYIRLASVPQNNYYVFMDEFQVKN